MPRGGGFGNLREAIRRLKEKRGGDMGMPRMPRIDDGRMRALPVDFGNLLPNDRMIGTPQPIPEQMPTDPSSYYNPTIFGQQMGDMDFSQMPEISPVDMSELTDANSSSRNFSNGSSANARRFTKYARRSRNASNEYERYATTYNDGRRRFSFSSARSI